MTTTSSTIRRTAAVAAVAALALTACDTEQDGDATVALAGEAIAVDDTVDASPARSEPSPVTGTATPQHATTDDSSVTTGAARSVRKATPAVYAVAAADRSLERSEVELSNVALGAIRAAEQRPSSDTIAEWIAALTRLERVLDADAIRALGDDPIIEQIAGPVDELDTSVLTVLSLLDPPDGSTPDLIGALTEAQTAVARWEAAVPDMEAAWAEAVAGWTADWEQATAEWEQAWADAVAEWEAAWAQAVADWEAEWAQAVTEWEQAWADAAAEWEQAWADAAAEWEAAWADAVAEWEAAWQQSVAERQRDRGRTEPANSTDGG